MGDPFELDIRYLKGVGEKKAQMFQRLGVFSVGALLRFYPRGYEDWSNITDVADLTTGETACICVTIIRPARGVRIRAGMEIFKVMAADDSGGIELTFFNARYTAQSLREGEAYLFCGRVEGSPHARKMTAPDVRPVSEKGIHPVYGQTKGLSSRMIEKAMHEAIARCADRLDCDSLPDGLRRTQQLCHLRYAIENVHFPRSFEALEMARERLVFEELLVLQLGMLQMRHSRKNETPLKMESDPTVGFLSLLPFEPTGAQRRALGEIIGDMRSGQTMNRLLQGDVGSGKTAVAAGACFAAVKSGWQAALMAPTEILAAQHAQSLSKLLSPAGIRIALLTGSTKAKERREILEKTKSGEIGLLIGTHSLIEETVEFHRLGLVVTDEQHRFGVAQRAGLSAKGEGVHVLVMSATPIPRTLALMIYGDLDVSVLDELPPGRQPIRTLVIGSDKRERAYGFIRDQIAAGRQAYLVCPAVEENETGLASAEEYAARLPKEAFAGIPVGLLHGKMKPSMKEQVMTDFAAGRLSLLISTTVIEVGVDVPNATVMLIENAERFGLSQLHQLRGRVGRGKNESFCILVSDAQQETARRRLAAMKRTNDGFALAQEDLELRGPGDFFGKRQHGLPELRIADMAQDMKVLSAARETARALLESDAELARPEHQALKCQIGELFRASAGQGLN